MVGADLTDKQRRAHIQAAQEEIVRDELPSAFRLSGLSQFGRLRSRLRIACPRGFTEDRNAGYQFRWDRAQHGRRAREGGPQADTRAGLPVGLLLAGGFTVFALWTVVMAKAGGLLTRLRRSKWLAWVLRPRDSG